MEAAEETAGFAALLRELKNRSGLSYGMLARRLHTSTSTLHRYCNGDAVPMEYAPVERFARTCGATPEELAELRRRWRLADEQRGKRAKPPAGAKDAAAPEGKPEPEPNPNPGPEPATPADRPRRRPLRGRRRTALLAGISVVLVAGAVALAARPVTGGDDRSDGAGPDRPAATATGHGRSGGDGPERADGSPPPAPRDGARPSASRGTDVNGDVNGKRNGPDRPANRATEHAGPPDGAVRGAVPLTVSTRPYAWQDPCSQHYLVDRPPAEVPPPPFAPGAPGWVADTGAVSSGSQYVELTVQGTGEETVVLNDLHVRVADRRAPLAWNDYGTGVGCGGDVPARHFGVDLDASRPDAEPAGRRDFPYKVSESDPEVLYVAARTDAYDVRWYLELEWSSGDRHGTLRIDDRGAPFRTSGARGRPSYVYPLGSDGWTPAPEEE